MREQIDRVKNFKQFNEGFKDIINNIYTELNPIEKWKKMKEYRIKLKKEVESLQKEVDEKKKYSRLN